MKGREFVANKSTNKNKAVNRTAFPVQPEVDTMSDEEFDDYVNAQKNEEPTVGKSSDREEITKDKNETENGAYSQESRRSYDDGRRQILERWFRDAERLKKEVPDFDLDEAMKNNEFRNYVINGMSVDGAYYAVKYKELTKNPRRSIMQNASSRALKPGSSMNDMLSMNDGDFRKRLRSIMNDD